MRKILGILMIISAIAQSKAQSGVNLRPFVALNNTSVINQERPTLFFSSPLEYAPNTGRYLDTLQGGSFTEREGNLPLEYRMPFSIEIGGQMETMKRNIICLSVNYTNLVRLGHSQEKDGYYVGSYIVDGEDEISSALKFRYNYLGLSASYGLQDSIGKLKFKFLFGASGGRILSGYHIVRLVSIQRYNEISEVQTYLDFERQELDLEDKIWVIQPDVDFQAKLLNLGKSELWLRSKMGFNVQKKYHETSLGHLWSNGLTLQF